MSNEKSISLDHGSGGLASQNLIGDLFLKYLTSPQLRDLEDCAVLGEHEGRIAFTTDSYVVDRSFFRAATSAPWPCTAPSTTCACAAPGRLP